MINAHISTLFAIRMKKAITQKMKNKNKRVVPEISDIYISYTATQPNVTENPQLSFILPSLTPDIDRNDSSDRLISEIGSNDNSENTITENPIKIGLGDVWHVIDPGNISTISKLDGYLTYIRHLKYYVQDIWYLSETLDIYLYVYCHCEDFNYMYKILPYSDVNETLYPGYGIFDESNERYDLIKIEPLSLDKVTYISMNSS